MRLTANTHAGPTSGHVPQHRICIASKRTRIGKICTRRRLAAARHQAAGEGLHTAERVGVDTSTRRDLGHPAGGSSPVVPGGHVARTSACERSNIAGLRSPASSLRRSGGSRATGADDADPYCDFGLYPAGTIDLDDALRAGLNWLRVRARPVGVGLSTAVPGWRSTAPSWTGLPRPSRGTQPDSGCEHGRVANAPTTDLVCFSEVPRRHRLGPLQADAGAGRGGYVSALGTSRGRGSTTTYHITKDGETARCRSGAPWAISG